MPTSWLLSCVVARTLHKVAQQNNFQGPGFHYVSQTLFWLVTQQRKNKLNYNLRSTSKILLQQPRITTLHTLGDRSFAVAAPALWNNLPNAIRSATSKTHLFKIAYFRFNYLDGYLVECPIQTLIIRCHIVSCVAHNEWMNVFIYRTYHILSQGGLQF